MKNAKKRISGKAILLLLAAVVILTATVGTVIAYLMAETPPVTNTFEPVSVNCEVTENFNPANNVKDNVAVKNTGEISAYIRATIVINWVSTDGAIYGGAPTKDTDYTVTLGKEGWFEGTDGFYYYKLPVAAGASTANLIEIITPVATAAPEGYTLSVQIVASAIQAEPATAVTTVWPAITVGDDGSLIP